MNRDTFAGTIDVEFELDGPKRLRGGDKREAPVPEASAPRLTRLMALAIKCLGMVERSEVLDYAELARVGYVTRARMSQIMNLVNLAPDIQEEILFLPKVSAVGPAARRVAQAAPGAPVLAVDALQCETDRTGWPVPPHKLVLARNNRRAPRKVPEQIVQHGVEQAFRSEGLLQTLVRDRLRIANTRNAQENNSRCNVLRRACDRSRRVQALYDRVARCFDGSASPHVLVQVSQRGCQDLLGRMRLSQARIRDRLRNPGGTERGNQQRIAFCPKGQDYPKTNMKSNVFSPCIHILLRRLAVEFKHAFQQPFEFLPVGPVRVAKERQEARNKRLLISGFWRQLTRQLASFARRLLHPGKPPFGRRRVFGMQPIDQGFQNDLLEGGVDFRDFAAQRQMQVLGNSDNDVFCFWFHTKYLHASVQLNMLTACLQWGANSLLGPPTPTNLLTIFRSWRDECEHGQPQLLRNSIWFRIVDMVALARRRKIRRNCSPTENRCCGARIMPARSRPALIHCV